MSRLALIISAVAHTTLFVGLSWVTMMTLEEDAPIFSPSVSQVPRVDPYRPPTGGLPPTPRDPLFTTSLPEVNVEFAKVTIPEVSMEMPVIRVEALIEPAVEETAPETECEPEPEAETTEVTEEEVVEVKVEDAEATLESEIRPVYPRRCRKKGHEGVVVVRLWIDSQGSVEKAEAIEKSRCKRLDSAALETALQLKYRPALRAGIQVSSETTVKIRFQLRG